MTDSSRTISDGALVMLDDYFRTLGIRIAPLATHSDADAEPRMRGLIDVSTASRVVFSPLGNGVGTGVFVYLGSHLLSFNGIRAAQTCPIGSGLPVVVIDAKGGPRVRYIVDEALSQVGLLKT